MKQPGLHVIHAAAVRDAVGVNARPGAVVVLNGRVEYAGDPEGLDASIVEHAETIDKRNSLLLPAMVNAHTHLELTDVGPRPYDEVGGLMGWVRMIRQAVQALEVPQEHGRDLLRSLKLGIEVFSRSSGVQAVGDIVSHPGRGLVRSKSHLDGVSYVELFGLGDPFDQAGLRAVKEDKYGLQPHAPYSAGPALYNAAARSGRPVSTHLAETEDEAAFVGRLEGPHLDYLKSIGKWDDAFAKHYGKGYSPVQWMRPYLEAAADAGGWLVAHCNYVSEEDIKILAGSNTSVAYCPIASEYFGHQNHRYRDMLDAGVNVCLGTDSIVCADPNDPQPLGLLSAMRRLYQRDKTEPGTLLAMATTHGIKALRMLPRKATLQKKAPARFVCIRIDTDDPADPLTQALASDAKLEPLDLTTFQESESKE